MDSQAFGPLALFITAVLATLVLYFWAKKAQLEKQLVEEREENERILAVAEDLEARLGALQQIGDRKLPIDTLDRLCEQYYIYEGTENLQPKILKEVRTIVEGLRSDPATRKALEQSLNKSSDHLMQRLRAAFPTWKEEDFLDSLKLSECIFIVNEDDATGNISGYAGLYMAAGEGEITNVATAPDYRKSGIGERLAEGIFNRARSCGITRIFLEVRQSNEPALRLYKKIGFVPVGKRPRFYSDPVEDAVLMEKDLNA